MVIYKDKTYVTNSDYPDEDFMGDADYVVADNSDLASNIIALYPNFKIVEDSEGNLTEIIAIEPTITDEDIKNYKAKRIEESKVLLAEWLRNNPYKYTDGNSYSCTEEKQSLLNSNLASYERSIAAGLEYPLRWNATGCECVSWNYEDLRALSLCIAGYVAPKVSIQQSIEIKIRSCKTIDEINSVVISYEN